MRQDGGSARGVLLLSGILLALCATFIASRWTIPSDGSYLGRGLPRWQADGVQLFNQPPGSREMHDGAVLVAVDGESLEDWLSRLGRPTAALRWQPGQQVVYALIRDGRRLDLPIMLAPAVVWAPLLQNWGTPLWSAVMMAIALFVFACRPAVPAARVMLVIGAAALADALPWSLGLQVPDLARGAGFWLFHGLTFGAYLLFWTATLHFTLIFPRPHPLLQHHPQRIRWLYGGAYLCLIAVLTAIQFSATGWLAALRWWQPVREGFGVILLGLALLSATTSYHRLAREPTARDQYRWMLYALLLSGGVALGAWSLPIIAAGRPSISSNLLGIVGLPIPLALAISILRYRLFDIDIIINRTLVYGALSAIVVGLYILVVGMLGAILEAHGSLYVSLAATGLVAVLFQPLRERLQRAVNRLMYGERDEPYTVLARLGQRLEATLAPASVLPTIVETIGQALKLPYVALVLSSDDRFETAAAWGVPQAGTLALPLAYQGDPIGQLLLAPRTRGDAFSPADRRLLADLVPQVEIAVHAVRLTADLQRSRERLVTAREEERRRLRRDLHDGLGPLLASLTLKLDATRNLLARDPHAADALLLDLKAQTQGAIGDIRRLVYALRPPALDDLGLVSALREQVQHYEGDGLRIVVEAPEHLPALPAAVEVAVYRIALEALTNVVRHARAHTCVIRLALNGVVRLDIVDDGVGLAAGHPAGVGLSSIRERAAELGGTCTLATAPGGGTHVTAHLPLPEDPAMRIGGAS